MSQRVTAGLGRNGPWLQNTWLRVETRQDDGTISPVALADSFRPSERLSARVQLAGESAIGLARCDYDVQSHEDRIGTGRRLTLISRQPRAGLALMREVVLYDAHPFAVSRVGVSNERAEPIRIEALHVYATPSSGRGRLQTASPPAGLRMYRNGWQSWAPTLSFGGSERDVQSEPHVLSPEQPQREAGRFASDDVGVLYDPASGRAMLTGAISARQFISQVYVDAPGRTLDARNLGDGMPLSPGATAWSERFLLDIVDDPNAQLARYGDALGREMQARVPERTPSGWCSWYYFFTTVTEVDVVRNLRFLERHRRELPIETVQIDDGYQADIGDWTIINEKFPRGMQWLASEIKSAGYTPGLWLAPFFLSESSRSFADHPEFVVRDDRGEPVVAMRNWERANYGLDGSNPEAQRWVEELFRQVCDGWGYDYVKIDFLFGAAISGRRHDASATRISAYRAALDAVRRGVGPERFILGCGSLMAPSVGFFDGNRIGPDCAPFWRFLTREERTASAPRRRRPDDLLSTETAMRNTMTRSWMHRRLWANDPDCLLVRADRTKLSIDEVRTMASIIGLSGGMMLSSDDLDQLPPDRLALISQLLPPLPESAVPADLMQVDMPGEFRAQFDREFDPVWLVAVINTDDMAQALTLDLPPGDWHVFERWEEAYVGRVSGRMSFPAVPPHATRLLALRPATGHPQLLATSAHIGMGVLDVLAQSWDPASARLRLTLGSAGTARRRIFVAGGAGSATLNGQPVPVRNVEDVGVIEAEVARECELVITFDD